MKTLVDEGCVIATMEEKATQWRRGGGGATISGPRRTGRGEWEGNGEKPVLEQKVIAGGGLE